MNNNIGCIIVTYNPDEERFEAVLKQATRYCDKILIIDNKSLNSNFIEKISENNPTIKLKKLDKNYGIGKALNLGLEELMYSYDYILTLDQDSILLENISNVIYNANLMFSGYKIGIISLNMHNIQSKKDYFIEINYPIISGSLINSELFKKGLKYREEFFMDQIDFDFDFNVLRMGYKIITTTTKMLDHRLGLIVNNSKKPIEPDWRLYLMCRNSFILLRERKINLSIFIWQLVGWFINDLLNGKPLTKLYKYFIIYSFGIKDAINYYMDFPIENKSLEKIESLLSKTKEH
ncbi:glycosyltransferase [Picrophilus oshimae]|uniref:Rhamnosyltransferase n=1 Tax=Picrophilus torridus (strain ATCC 700027 / DSM 9790 / JCM 10055 / NBRC 100828 / KAW 2/3) TaxID=1122961 RepID=A0A8G2FWI2_PICTO|nr:glycosyltransferase [Picrophilus oshimae]SMD30772.1 rhamnosyltransferase [Picrophilus oshimae DSM 9789]